jgi:glucose-6-phosphate isomerase
MGQIRVAEGVTEKQVTERLGRFQETAVARRLWEKDPTLWSEDASVGATIANRLGWLDVVRGMEEHRGDLNDFAGQCSDAGYRRILLLGMGGSSLCPEVLRLTFGVAPDRLDLRVLDSTSPDTVADARKWAQQAKTAVLVASKSGTTIEVQSFYQSLRKYFPDPADFIAVTDPNTYLAQLSAETGFRKTFLNPPDIGGRYSALSYFGLLPAALLGMDVGRLLASANSQAASCGPEVAASDNPGLRLGALLGESARLGRDKLTLVFAPQLRSFGTWVEQLVAESTGKNGVGILPIEGEPMLPPADYGSDRVFVITQLRSHTAPAMDGFADELRQAGHPVAVIDLDNLHDLGGEFFRWEIATAIAGVVLGINPFDEPNVTESKDLTKSLLAKASSAGKLPQPDCAVSSSHLEIYVDEGLGRNEATVAELLRSHFARITPGDYVAILAYLHPSEIVCQQLTQLRELLVARSQVPVTLGYGPRFLHSTGQLHKGGANQGLFLQITGTSQETENIPGSDYDFATLIEAQALGDWQALARRDRRLLRCHLREGAEVGLPQLLQQLTAAL